MKAFIRPVSQLSKRVLDTAPPPATPPTHVCRCEPMVSCPAEQRSVSVITPHNNDTRAFSFTIIEFCVIKCSDIIWSGDFPAEQLGNQPTEFESGSIL